MTDRTVICGRYELDGLHLARGGMGEVWGGRDRELNRRVAVKLVRLPDGPGGADPELERRFVHEARIMARLDHPGIPPVHDLGVFEDLRHGRRLFMVMQFVEGVALDHVVDEHGPLPVGWAAAIGAQVAAVLAAAHERAILHRDLKPSNLMLCADGAVKVLDFGLAVLHDPEVTRLTSTGRILGTAAYMSPEQVLAQRATARSDLYALGCVLHELLTGHRLFTGPSEFDVMHRQVNEPAPPVRRERGDVPPELDELIGAMLAKRPEDRPPDARAVHDRLLPYVAGARELPGVVAAHAGPLRMYANVLSRMLSG